MIRVAEGLVGLLTAVVIIYMVVWGIGRIFDGPGPKRRELKRLQAENLRMRSAINEVFDLALENRAYEPILADLVLNRLKDHRKELA